jgi:hypothetical protein
MKTKILLLFLVLLVPNGKLFLQEIPDCWCIPTINEGNPSGENDDMVAIDTCNLFPQRTMTCNDWISNVSDYNKVKGRQYAYQRYEVVFLVDVFHLPVKPDGSIIEVAIDDMDSTYSTLIGEFRNIENKMCKFKFRKKYPSMKDNQRFILFFEDYVHVGTTVNMINKINYVRCYFVSEFEIILPTVEEDDNSTDNDIYFVYNDNTILLKVLNINKEIEMLNIDIYNILGTNVLKSCIKKNEGIIDISHLNNGLYFLKVNNKVFKILVLKQ